MEPRSHSNQAPERGSEKLETLSKVPAEEQKLQKDKEQSSPLDKSKPEPKRAKDEAEKAKAKARAKEEVKSVEPPQPFPHPRLGLNPNKSSEGHSGEGKNDSSESTSNDNKSQEKIKSHGFGNKLTSKAAKITQEGLASVREGLPRHKHGGTKYLKSQGSLLVHHVDKVRRAHKKTPNPQSALQVNQSHLNT